MTEAAEVHALLNRIKGYLDAEVADPASKGRTYHPEHPTTMLFEAEDMIEDLAMRCGLIPTPRTVARTTDWDRVEATTEAQIARQIIEDLKE